MAFVMAVTCWPRYVFVVVVVVAGGCCCCCVRWCCLKGRPLSPLESLIDCPLGREKERKESQRENKREREGRLITDVRFRVRLVSALFANVSSPANSSHFIWLIVIMWRNLPRLSTRPWDSLRILWGFFEDSLRVLWGFFGVVFDHETGRAWRRERGGQWKRLGEEYLRGAVAIWFFPPADRLVPVGCLLRNRLVPTGSVIFFFFILPFPRSFLACFSVHWGISYHMAPSK